MTAGDLSFSLFVKMSEELRGFQEWLKTQPPDEILRHSYEYAVKVDIMAFVEQFNLDEERTRALLSLDEPLEAVYKAHDDKGLTTIERMMETVECFADEIREMHDANAKVAVYPHSEEYANAHGEWGSYQMSTHLNAQCKEAIEMSITDHYALRTLDPEAVHQVVAQFGEDRVRYVLDNTFRFIESGRRFAFVVQRDYHMLKAFDEMLNREYPIDKAHRKESVKDKLKVRPKEIRRNFRRISSKDQER